MTTIPEDHHTSCKAEAASLSHLRSFIEQCCAGLDLETGVLYDLQLAVDEAASNIIRHGYKNRTPGLIELTLRILDDRIEIQVTDYGHPFNPEQAPQPDINAPLDERQPGGLGIFLIYTLMDQVSYQSHQGANTLSLTKKRLKEE